MSIYPLTVSGKRGSNPRPWAWEAHALPTELLPQKKQSHKGEIRFLNEIVEIVLPLLFMHCKVKALFWYLQVKTRKKEEFADKMRNPCLETCQMFADELFGISFFLHHKPQHILKNVIIFTPPSDYSAPTKWPCCPSKWLL